MIITRTILIFYRHITEKYKDLLPTGISNFCYECKKRIAR